MENRKLTRGKATSILCTCGRPGQTGSHRLKSDLKTDKRSDVSPTRIHNSINRYMQSQCKTLLRVGAAIFPWLDIPPIRQFQDNGATFDHEIFG